MKKLIPKSSTTGDEVVISPDFCAAVLSPEVRLSGGRAFKKGSAHESDALWNGLMERHSRSFSYSPSVI